MLTAAKAAAAVCCLSKLSKALVIVVGEGGVEGGQLCGDAVCCVGRWLTNATAAGR